MQGFCFEGIHRRACNGDCELYHREQCDSEADSKGVWNQ